jgi:hypothetical protein
VAVALGAAVTTGDGVGVTAGVGDALEVGDGVGVGVEVEEEPPQAATDKAAATITPATSLRTMLLIAER